MSRRRFRVWKCRCGCGAWRWCCTLCDPPVHGARHGPDAWQRIMATSWRGHSYRRFSHHEWVARNRPLADTASHSDAGHPRPAPDYQPCPIG